MRLLSKRRVPANAFEDKVVWVTGASQVNLILNLVLEKLKRFGQENSPKGNETIALHMPVGIALAA